MKKIKVIVFDMDGTLTDTGSSTWTVAHEAFGTLNDAKPHKELFEAKKIDVFEWGVFDISLWTRKGVTKQDFERVFQNIKLVEGVEETLKELKSKGYKIALVTGGLSVVAEMIAKKFGFDYVFSSELAFDYDGLVVGLRRMYDFETKVDALKEIAEKEGIGFDRIAVVGDSSNDIDMFKKAGFRVAFCPDSKELEKVADVVVNKKNLKEILKYF